MWPWETTASLRTTGIILIRCISVNLLFHYDVHDVYFRGLSSTFLRVGSSRHPALCYNWWSRESIGYGSQHFTPASKNRANQIGGLPIIRIAATRLGSITKDSIQRASSLWGILNWDLCTRNPQTQNSSDVRYHGVSVSLAPLPPPTPAQISALFRK
jgi:hypothetical protein